MKVALIILCLSLSSITSLNAELINRGQGLIYDSTQNITWMQDASYADGSIALNWYSAMDWASTLNYAGHDNWRLPITMVPDYSCENSKESAGLHCNGSEMGHLFYVDNVSAENPVFFLNVKNYFYWSSSDMLLAPDYDMGYMFSFGDDLWPFEAGHQEILIKDAEWGLGAWAVADGDIASSVAPEPISSILFITGGAMLGFRRRFIKK